MKRIYALLMALSLILLLSLSASGANQSGVRILVDGEALHAPASYISQDGTTMVPLRAVAEALGCEVAWDPATRTVSIVPPSASEEPRYSALVVLDPGHGGEANGAEYGGVKERI